MISIIICSRTAVISSSLKDNIEATIGTEYEIILIDNSTNQYSIFQAYNLGVKQSKYALLCFMHDDIKHHTPNWGKIILKHFEDETTGAIGIAGSPCLPLTPGSWWSSGLVDEIIIPWHGDSMQPVIKQSNDTNTNKSRVVVLDGVLMFIRRAVFDKVKFDEDSFKGYHFYDIDISLQIHQSGYRLYCAFDILIQHFSKGDMNLSWLQNSVVLHRKWDKYLPASCIPLSYTQSCNIELKALGEYIDVMLYNGFSKTTTWGTLVKQMAKFSRGYFFYKTPLYLLKYTNRIVNYNKVN